MRPLVAAYGWSVYSRIRLTEDDLFGVYYPMMDFFCNTCDIYPDSLRRGI